MPTAPLRLVSTPDVPLPATVRLTAVDAAGDPLAVVGTAELGVWRYGSVLFRVSQAAASDAGAGLFVFDLTAEQVATLRTHDRYDVRISPTAGATYVVLSGALEVSAGAADGDPDTDTPQVVSVAVTYDASGDPASASGALVPGPQGEVGPQGAQGVVGAKGDSVTGASATESGGVVTLGLDVTDAAGSPVETLEVTFPTAGASTAADADRAEAAQLAAEAARDEAEAVAVVDRVPALNLFDKDAVVTGSVSTSTGVVSGSATFSTSEFLAVEPSTVYARTDTSRATAWYDASQAFISGVSGVATVKSPANAAFARATYATSTLATAMFVRGSYTGPYSAYTEDTEVGDLRVTGAQTLDALARVGVVDAAGLLRPDAARWLDRTSPNLFDPRTATLGHRLSNANVVADAGQALSAPIPISPSTAYTANAYAGGRWAEYDADGLYLRNATFAASGTLYTYVSGADAHSLVVSVAESVFPTFMLVEGAPADFPGTFQPYDRFALGGSVLAEPKKHDGQTLAVLGDSLSDDADGWWLQMNAALGFTNDSFQDSNTSPVEERYAVAGASIERRPGIGTVNGTNHEVTAFVDRVQYLDTERDVVYVLGGTNGWANPVGANTLGNLDAAIAAWEADTEPDATSTRGAMVLLLTSLIDKFPNKPIRFVTPPPRVSMFERTGKLGAVNLVEYSDVLEEVCKRFGVPCFHAIRQSRLRPYDASNLALNYADLVHLNTAGHVLLGTQLAAWERTLG